MSKKPLKKTATPVRVIAKSEPANQPSMRTAEIRDLIDFIAKSGLNEVNIETKELKLSIKREPDQKVFKSTPMLAPAAVSMTAPQVQLPPVAAAQAAAKTEPATQSQGAGKKTVDIKSPMIGTFYRSGNPDTPPFVSIGDKITKGQPVCIIEAMKLFNEIESEVSGTIVRVMVENASPVEYDQVLFVVEPD